MNFKHLERHIGFVLLCLVLGVSYFQGTSQAVEWNNAAHPNEYNFTDYDLTGKPIRLVHFNELRLAMDSTNTACSLGVTLDWPTVFTDNVAVGKPIKASHMARLRANLQSLYDAHNAAHPSMPLSFANGSSLLETNNTDIPATTTFLQGKVIKKSDIQDMRDAINALRAQCLITTPCNQPICYSCSGPGNSCIQDNTSGTFATSTCGNTCTSCGAATCYSCSGAICAVNNTTGTFQNSNCNNTCSAAPSCGQGYWVSNFGWRCMDQASCCGVVASCTASWVPGNYADGATFDGIMAGQSGPGDCTTVTASLTPGVSTHWTCTTMAGLLCASCKATYQSCTDLDVGGWNGYAYQLTCECGGPASPPLGACGAPICYSCLPGGVCRINFNGYFSEPTCGNSCVGPCGETACYSCSPGNDCVRDDRAGLFKTSDCDNTCKGPCGAANCYSCNGGACVADDSGGPFSDPTCGNTCIGPCGASKCYSCAASFATCVENDVFGTYASMAACDNVCNPPPNVGCPTCYTCNSGYACVLDPVGPYNNLSDCTTLCHAPGPAPCGGVTPCYGCGAGGSCVVNNVSGFTTNSNCNFTCFSGCDLKKALGSYLDASGNYNTGCGAGLIGVKPGQTKAPGWQDAKINNGSYPTQPSGACCTLACFSGGGGISGGSASGSWGGVLYCDGVKGTFGGSYSNDVGDTSISPSWGWG